MSILVALKIDGSSCWAKGPLNPQPAGGRGFCVPKSILGLGFRVEGIGPTW